MSICTKSIIYSSLSMKFCFEEIEQFLLPSKDFSQQTARWQIDHVFSFHLNEYQLRKRFLKIEFLDKTNNIVGQIKINLYILATGPFHQDFALNLTNQPQARVSFNLKIAQIIKMKFQFLEAKMKPYEKEYPGDKFAFSVRSIMGHTTKYTNQSYVVSVAFDQEQFEKQNSSTEKKETAEQTKKKSRIKSKKSIINNLKINELQVDRNNIRWSKQLSTGMPEFNTQIPLFDMHSSAFHIMYWGIDSANNQNQILSIIQSQCFVSINKLLNFQSEIVEDETGIPYEQRVVNLTQKNWSHGKEVGQSQFKIKFSIQKHIKQMQVCVRTEQGIMKSSPVFSNEEAKSGSKEINELIELAQVIDNEFIELAKSQKQNGSTLQVRRNIERIVKLMNEEKELLNMSVKQSVMFFNYKDEKELLKSQEQLIAIAFKTRSYINENIEEITSSSFALLSALMKRGELNLAQMGFNLDRKTDDERTIPKDIFQKKKIIALKYQELLNQLMIIALFSLNFKGQQSEKEFAELFCALAYFRVPQFRVHILKSIEREMDPDIQEWRGTDFNLNDQTDQNKSKKLNSIDQQLGAYELLFDWEKNFYRYIEREEVFRKNMNELDVVLRDSEWEGRIKKRKGAFFSFVKYWCEYVESIAIYSKNLNWKYFPGYNKILHAFLVEMKRIPLAQFSDRMEKACVSLLHNDRLLNTFVAIMYKKADLNNPLSLLKMLHYLDLFFETVNKKNRLIPTTFDYNHFLKGIKMILESSHSHALAKTILLFYDHFNIFSADFKYYISMLLMGKLFFRLFLHWSKNVRTIFHHLLYIRIYKLTESNILTSKGFSRKERLEILTRYQKLMMILENANQMKKAEDKTEKVKNQKDYYKKMKKKLYNKKNKKYIEKNQQQLQEESMFRQLAYNPRKNSAADCRLLEELSKPKLERYQSEIMTKNLKIAIQIAKTRKDEIIPLKSSHQIEAVSEIELKTSQNFEKMDFVRKVALLTPEQMQIWQMTKNETEYLSASLEEYSDIHKLLLKHLQRNSNIDSVPVVKLQVAFDYEDIRPEGIDEW